MPAAHGGPDHHLSHQEETVTESNHPYIWPGQVAPGRRAPDCVQCGEPEAAHGVPSAAELLGMLRAVREAIDIPYAATNGDDETRAKIMNGRLMEVAVQLRHLDDPRPDWAWSAAYLRQRLTLYPAVGYRTWDDVRAEHKAADAAAREAGQ
jgi:hypothetical protein